MTVAEIIVDVLAITTLIVLIITCVTLAFKLLSIIDYVLDLIEHAIKSKLERLKRPKCPNGYNCPDCIYSDTRFEGIKFRGFSCRIDAR